MKNNSKSFYKNYEQCILLLAVIIRVVVFVANLFVSGLQLDEIMTSDNAFSIADNGTDIFDNSYPIYFSTWIYGGQSSLPTYLAALFVKLFGKSIFSVRFPMLILSILGIFAFYGFLKTVFDNSEFTKIAISLAAVSPWAIFSGAYMLDCNTFAYSLLFASYFLAKAIKKDKKSTMNYIVSMLFFALCFYSYIASVMFVPPMLVVVYLALIIKKKISFKNVSLSILFIVIFSLPFILQGLTAVKVIDDFKFLNITFGGMGEFTRESDVSFGISEMINNLTNSFYMIFVSDTALSVFGQNMFFYGYVFAGFFVLLGFIYLAILVIKRKKEFDFVQVLFFIGYFVGLICFCALIKGGKFTYLYRYGVLSFVLIMFESAGFIFAGKIVKKLKLFDRLKQKNIFIIYITISLCVFFGVFSFLYASYTKNGIDFTYADSYFDCLDYLEEKEADDINVLSIYQRRMMVFNKFYYFGDDDLFEFKDNYETMKNNRGTVKINNKIQTTSDYGGLKLTEKYYVIRQDDLDYVNYDGYKIVDKGEFVVLEK